jgi:UDP-N-acetyl-D-glucosamine dehydrogenase
MLVSSPEVAEAAKLFENTFRQVNIALVNEFAQITFALGLKASEVLAAASTKPFGFMRFVPSIGVGGHCIPVDPIYLNFAAHRVGLDSSFINLADKVNENMAGFILKRLEEALNGSVRDKKIQVSGISYKSGVSDLRESPVLTLISLLRKNGAKVIWHDDVVESWNGEYSTPIQEVDLGVVATSHPSVDYSKWITSKTMVVDLSSDVSTSWVKFL